MSAGWQARSKARMRAMQALYQCRMNAAPLEDILAEYGIGTGRTRKTDREYFRQLVSGVLERQPELEGHLAPLLDRKPDQLDEVERAILQIGAYELLHQADTPWKTIINEAVELAKAFGAEQSSSYVNAVLDKLARKVRTGEAEGGARTD